MARKKTQTKAKAPPKGKKAETAKVAPQKVQATSWLTPGTDTSDIAQRLPEVRVKNRESILIRHFPVVVGGELHPFVRVSGHRVPWQGRYRWFTTAPEADPIGMALGKNPSYQWVTLGMVMGANKDSYNAKLLGRIVLVSHGKRAIDFLNAEVLPTLQKQNKKLWDVTLEWKRLGEGTESQHLFKLVKGKPFTADQKKAIKDAPNVLDIIQPVSHERQIQIAQFLATSKQAETAPEGGWQDREVIDQAEVGTTADDPWFAG